MPPKTLTSAGLETVDETVARARAMVPSAGTTPVKAGTTPTKTGQPTETITTQNLAPRAEATLAAPVVATAAPALQAEIQAGTDQFTANLEAEAARLQPAATSGVQSYIDQLTQARGLTGLTDEAYRADGGVDDVQSELNSINDQIRREQRALDLATRNIEDKGGGLKAGAQSEIANLTRDSLRRQADLSIIQLAVQGRYDSAKAIADRAVTAQLEQQTNDLAIAKFNYDENKELFTKAEQRAFEAKVADRERQLTEEKENRTAIYDLAIQAQLDGAPTDVVQGMMSAKTKEEAAKVGGSYIGALDRQVKEANIAQSQASVRSSDASAASSYASRRNSLITAAKDGDPQAISELGFDPSKSTPLSEYSNIVDTASLLVGAERGEQTRRAMAAAIERGDYTTAYSQIANNVQSSLQGESASRFGSARTDIQVLSGLRDVIQEFEAAGGDTGFLKGNADQIARKFGQLATDPRFAALAVQMEREFQAYRQQMTGAAFGAGESADYEKVVPSATKSIELNLATIDGALNQLENRVTGTVEAYVPGSRDIYDIVTGNEKVIPTTDPSIEPIGSVIEYGGVRYRKVGEDAYEPI